MGSVGFQIKLIKQKIVKYVKSTIEANIQGGRNQGATGGFSITNFLRLQLGSTVGRVPSPIAFLTKSIICATKSVICLENRDLTCFQWSCR